MTDLIKRDDALAAIYEDSPEWTREAIAALPAIDPAATREAALREAYDVVYKWWFGDGNALPQELILALIEKGAADGMV
jgi:hypothetical protein